MDVFALLSKARIPCSTEKEMQSAIESVLKANGIAYVRESRLSAKDVIDFLVGTIGIECKIDGQALKNHRQLERYLAHPALSEVILVTAKHQGTTGSHNGKPIRIIKTGTSWL